MTRCHSSASTWWASPPPATPAALTTPSSRPPAGDGRRHERRHGGFVGDVGGHVAPAGRRGRPARRRGRRPRRWRRRPSRRLDVARPMPDAAPVTITTLPSSLLMDLPRPVSCTTCAMRFALFYEIPVARPWGPDSERLAYQHTIEQAVAGEQYGWDAFWTVEHHFLEEYSHCSNPEVLYGAIAARTERMRLGFGVRLMPKPYNHPVRTAESVAVLDLISNGRVDLGTGRSSTRAELEGFGIDPGADPGHVAGGHRPRRRLLDERRVRVRGRALVDAEAPRAARSRSSRRTRRSGAPPAPTTATGRSASSGSGCAPSPSACRPRR